MQRSVQMHCAPVRASGADTVVLGCTHYPFALELIRKELGDSVTLIDTADAVARQAARLCDLSQSNQYGRWPAFNPSPCAPWHSRLLPQFANDSFPGRHIQHP